MKKELAWIFTAAMMLMFATGCKTPKSIDSTYAYNSFETQCLGTDLDGSQTLRAWGKGRDKAQAIEQARKNAVRDVIFKGIVSGTGECNKKPLLNEVNAAEKYEAYFDRFFADGGIYKSFTSLGDEKRLSQQKSADNSMDNYGVVVRVNRAALRQRLIDDGVLKQ